MQTGKYLIALSTFFLMLGLGACSSHSQVGDESAFPKRSNAQSAKIFRPELDRIPQHILDSWRLASNLVGTPDLTWDREVITVAFVGGSDPVYELIELTASEWTQGGGVRFSFRHPDGSFRKWSPAEEFPAAAIRIAFSTSQNDGGYWSAIGTMAEDIPGEWQTMNFGGFENDLSPYFGRGNTQEWQQSYEHSTILHEFGHALGLSHEHFHDDCQSDLRIDEAVKAIAANQGWTIETARFQIDAEYYFSNLVTPEPGKPAPVFDISPEIDEASVMLYGGLEEYTNSREATPCKPTGPLGYATALSVGDRASFVRYYPAR